MKFLTLDPKCTHVNNPDCPMRLVPTPDKQGWMCLDCGFRIVMTSVEVMPVKDATGIHFTRKEIEEEYEKRQQEERRQETGVVDANQSGLPNKS